MTSKTWFYRDLTARNCMISADKVVKVGDLGLARHVYMTDFYHTSSNVGFQSVGWPLSRLPVLRQEGILTCQEIALRYFEA